jgi:hypothetical protein
MLTDEQMNSGLINPAYRWPNKRVPFFIDPVFREYCSTKIKGGCGAWRELSIHYMYRFNCSTTGH